MKKPDYPFILLLVLIVIIGIIMVFSSSSAMALKNTGDSFYFVKRHVLYIVLGMLAFYYGLNLNLSKLRKFSPHFIAGTFLLSFLVFLPGLGKTAGGASRWIELGEISFQPSELLKLAVVIFLSNLLARNKDNIKAFISGLFPLLLVCSVAVIPVLLQPDLGTALAILGSALMMFFIAGARIPHLVFVFLCGGAGVAFLSFTSAYRMRRLLSFRDPWSDPLGSGYQIIQSLIAVSSGSIIGLGLGNSKQKFLYLPQQYADFIFAILCEELGFIGAAVFLVLLCAFLIRGFVVSAQNPIDFSGILGSGIMLMFAVQAFLNIAVVLGLVPTTGLPLPFISYGGTAMVVNLFSAGIVANISRK